MNITFEELRNVKHSLPKGSISKIASQLNITEQTVRNYFGAQDYASGNVVNFHKQQGPNGGIVHLEDESIYNLALSILQQNQSTS